MHYIRFLKSPKLVRVRIDARDGRQTIEAKVTVTTDLGESFLAADIGLVVCLVDGDGKNTLGPGKKYLWKGRNGMRSLEVSIPMAKVLRTGRVRMVISPEEELYKVGTFEQVLGGEATNEDESGGVVAIRSMEINLQDGKPAGTGIAERVFTSTAGDTAKEIHIWEETGESIARHVWYATPDPDRDAGLVLSSYIASIASTQSASSTTSLPHLPLLEQTLSQPNLNILELGAGCGIVGITLSHILPSTSQILLTDLPEASEILTHNLSSLTPSLQSNITHQILDWSLPLPLNVSSTHWNLIVVADCTYNPDVVPDLVKTLRAVAEGNREVVVLLAMKVRHESELVFFDLMTEAGFGVMEKCRVPLPVLDGEGERIEIFDFGYKTGELGR